MQLSPTFGSNIRDIYGQKGETWLSDLPKHIEKLSQLWHFHFLKPMPELSYNFVGLVQMNAGRKAILKMSPEGGNLASEMQWLNCIEKGVPEIYAFDESLNAYLMEQLVPGQSLKSLVREGRDDEATRIICHTIIDLQSQHCQKTNFRHLSEFSKDFVILEGHFDARLLSKAEQLFRDLTKDRTSDILLHGDLHHDNILSSGSEWKAIDPHGYIGDPVAEVGTMFRNPLDCFPSNVPLVNVVERRLNIMAEELPFDAQRIKDWAFCITVLSAAWSVEGHGRVEKLEAEVAAALDQIRLGQII